MVESAPRFTVGVDENGLGPRLGPMTVTGVLLSVCVDDRAYASAASLAGIGDSKSLCAHGSMRDVESLVLAMCEVHLGAVPASLRDLLRAVNLHDEEWLRAPCPDTDAPRACFGADVALPAYGPGVTSHARGVASTLLASGVALQAVRAVSVCARRLNDARDLGRSRFDVDLAAMLDLVVRLRSLAPEDLVAVCGKVGGRKSYDAALSTVFSLASTLECTPRRSAYRVPTVGSVEFLQDADAICPAVSLASLFGKYLRELSMERMHRYYAARVPDLVRASGYHDPVTARFVAATDLIRREKGIETRCFER